MVAKIGHELNETTIELLAEALPGEQSVDAREVVEAILVENDLL
jgi:hypothetical protein